MALEPSTKRMACTTTDLGESGGDGMVAALWPHVWPVRLSSDVSETEVFSIPPHRPSPISAQLEGGADRFPSGVVRYDARAGELARP